MKISFYPKRNNKDAADTTAIFALISYDNQRVKYYTPYNVLAKYWNTKQQRVSQTKNYPTHPEINFALDTFVGDVAALYTSYLANNEYQQPTATELKTLIDTKVFKKPEPLAPKPLNLYAYFEKVIGDAESGKRKNSKDQNIGLRTIQDYRLALALIKALQLNSKRKDEYDFHDIDLEFYTDFTAYLRDVKMYKVNNIGKYIKILKIILNDATEQGVNTNLKYKSRKFKKVTEPSDSIYLSPLELDKLAKLDLSHNLTLDAVRDMFVIGCYTGLRYSDYTRVNSSHVIDGMIEIKQQKTAKKVVIPIQQDVQRILDKYKGNMPTPISNQRTNEYLKTIGAMIPELDTVFHKEYTLQNVTVTKKYKRYELLCSHTARRTFATNEYKALTPAISIMAITGHKTEKDFIKYIKLTNKEHAQIVKMLQDERLKNRYKIGS
jgi:Phage integrase SAM-like domain